MAPRKRVLGSNSLNWRLVSKFNLAAGTEVQSALLNQLFTEIVLSLLLRRFRFSFGDKKIIWKMNGLNQPIIEDAELDRYGLPMLQMPLRVVPLSEF